MKKLSVLLLTVIGVFGLNISASAHVTVKPAVSQIESYETYTMKVPNEKESITNKVVLVIPKEVTFYNYQPIPGWKVTTDKTKDDKIERVTWEKEKNAGGIDVGQFQQFSFDAKNPDKEGAIDWDAYQYYEDKSIVEWTGDADSDSPHSQTTIEKATEKIDSHGHTKATNTKDSGNELTNNTTTISLWIISGLALLASVMAIVLSTRKK